MGIIADQCQANGMRLEILAAHMGILPSLLKSMDAAAVSVPAEIRDAMNSLVLLRDRLIEAFENSLLSQRQNISRGYREQCNVVVVYTNQEDYESLPDYEPQLNHITHRYVIEFLQTRMLRQHGIEITSIIFDRPTYEIWLGKHTDSLESRAMWAVQHLFAVIRLNGGKTH